MASNKSVLEKEDILWIRPALRHSYTVLSENIKATEILPALFAKGVFSLESKQELECIKERGGSIRFARAMIDKLLETSSTEQELLNFMKVLKEHQHVLYETIVNWIRDHQNCKSFFVSKIFMSAGFKLCLYQIN